MRSLEKLVQGKSEELAWITGAQSSRKQKEAAEETERGGVREEGVN